MEKKRIFINHLTERRAWRNGDRNRWGKLRKGGIQFPKSYRGGVS